MSKDNYNVQEYWSEVASRIKDRNDRKNVIAGDDEPFYRYKRQKFLDLLLHNDFEGKTVLEIGCGPGGNLKELTGKSIKKLAGADISQDMLDLAKSKLPSEVSLHKTDGFTLPFEDKSFDIVFTATVLQHNTDDNMAEQLIKEMTRVSRQKILIYESLSPFLTGDVLCKWRPPSFYIDHMKNGGFTWESTKFINVSISYYMAGAIRKVLNSNNRKEGEPLNRFSMILQKLLLPVTSILDKIFVTKKDLAQMVFVRSL